MIGASQPCPKCSATSGGDWSQCSGSCPMPMSPHHGGRKHALTNKTRLRPIIPQEDQLCLQSHYAAIVEASREVEIYQLGDVDCSTCLRRMIERHEAIAEVFRAKLATIEGSP